MQLYIRQIMTRLFLLVGIIFIIYLCIFGTHGLLKLRILEKENKEMIALINKHENELQQLKEVVYLWEDSAFLKEKEAREKLHMAYKDDIVYYVQTE